MVVVLLAYHRVSLSNIFTFFFAFYDINSTVGKSNLDCFSFSFYRPVIQKSEIFLNCFLKKI